MIMIQNPLQWIYLCEQQSLAWNIETTHCVRLKTHWKLNSYIHLICYDESGSCVDFCVCVENLSHFVESAT